MQRSSIAAKFPIPWANAAGAGLIRAIPTASQIGVQLGAASLTDGLPPACFNPIAGGGSWPFGQDFNGILKQITQWNQWHQAGGPICYDAAFSAAIGGYPIGTLLMAAGLQSTWLSTVDNNTSDPDTGGANWLGTPLGFTSVQQGGGAGQGANKVRIGWDAGGAGLLRYQVDATDEGNLASTAWVAASYATEAALAAETAGRSYEDTVLQGAITAEVARAEAAEALKAPIANPSFTGSVNVQNQLTTGGNITAVNGLLRATYGATGSGDNNAATILNDFPFLAGVLLTSGITSGYLTLPNGMMIQWGTEAMPGGTQQYFLVETAFPTAMLTVLISVGAGIVGSTGGFGADPADTASFLVGNNFPSGGSTEIAFHWIAIGH